MRNSVWSIVKGKKVIRFADSDDRYGDDMDFIAKKKGTVTITCTNTRTKKKVSYTIKVVKPKYEDDYYTNYYDEDSYDNSDYDEYYEVDYDKCPYILLNS